MLPVYHLSMVILMKLLRYLNALYTSSSIRNEHSEIPNIIGTLTAGLSGASDWTGAFTLLGNSEWGYTGGSFHFQRTSFNASNCSNRYGDYTEVNPLYNSCKFILKY